MFHDLMNNETNQNHGEDFHVDFSYKKIKPKDKIELSERFAYYLIFVLEGKVRAEYNGFNIEVSKGNMFFVSSNYPSKIESIDESALIIDSFKNGSDIYDIDVLESYQYECAEKEYSLISIPVKSPVEQSLDLLLSYMQEEIDEPEMHDLKHKEVILLLRWYYSRQEYVKLFHEIICKALDFKSVVLTEYLKTKSIDELAEKLGISRERFEVKFKQTFGISPKQWIVKNIAKNIKSEIAKPNTTLNDIMIKYDFESYSQFSRFCKRQFGATPQELKKKH